MVTRALLCAVALLLSCSTVADSATIAVAANFRSAAQALIESLERDTSHRYRLVAGSTGKLYAQITQGAPFDAFLAADITRAERLVTGGFASGAAQPYAQGRLALWHPSGAAPHTVDGLIAPSVERVAMANPRLAPYGAASLIYLQRLGIWDALQGKTVFADNVGTAHALVASGNADAGLVALSTLRAAGIPKTAYTELTAPEVPPITQAAVLLRRAEGNVAARLFFETLLSDESEALLLQYGLRSPVSSSAGLDAASGSSRGHDELQVRPQGMSDNSIPQAQRPHAPRIGAAVL